MSFDLYVLDLDPVPDGDGISALLADEAAWGGPLTPALAGLVAELEADLPGLDDDPDASPWASWPLSQPMAHGRCCAFNITWSAAEAVAERLTASATARGLAVYDPQSGSVTGPPRDPTAGPPRRGWLRRR